MGLFGFGSADGNRRLRKHVERVANKRAFAPERMESIMLLGEDKSEEAIAGLLARFNYKIDPSITDQEEKEATFAAICAAGSGVRDVVLSSLHKEKNNVAWQLRILNEILPASELCEELLKEMKSLDTDYERDPEKKLSILAALEDKSHPRVVAEVQAFLQDASERVRYAALRALSGQQNRDEAREAVIAAANQEESFRVLIPLLDLIAESNWTIDAPSEQLRARLPEGYQLDKSGRVTRR